MIVIKSIARITARGLKEKLIYRKNINKTTYKRPIHNGNC